MLFGVSGLLLLLLLLTGTDEPFYLLRNYLEVGSRDGSLTLEIRRSGSRKNKQ